MSFTDALRGLQSLQEGGGDEGGDRDGDDARPWTVSETCDRVNRALSEIEAGGEIQVEGEVGDCSIRDHWYFTLRDERGAKLSCSFFSQRRRGAGSVPTPSVGMKVVVSGRLEYWTKGGRLSLIVSSLREAGVGDLHQRFERLKVDLEQRGWFDPARRLALPAFATSALVLTSADGAARRDVEETARRRWPGFRLHLASIPVQGEAATPRIATAIRAARRLAPSLGVDAIILTRGGGSLEDLWCFNEETVAAAIIESRNEAVRREASGGPPAVPLIAAIGHEVDVSIAEFCADHRASTPTQAAMVLVPDAEEQREVLDTRRDRLGLLVQRTVERAAGRAALAERHEVLRRPARLLDPHRRRLEDAARRWSTLATEAVGSRRAQVDRHAIRLEAVSPFARITARSRELATLGRRLARLGDEIARRRRERVAHLAARLRSVGPDEVLARGYALVLTEDGRPVRAASEVSIDDRIIARLGHGSLEARVEARRGNDDDRHDRA